MNNCEKKLDALIDALGFDVEEVMRDAVGDEEPDIFLLTKDYCVDYKLTKREVITSIPKGHFIDAAANGWVRGIGPKSSNSKLQMLMQNFTEAGLDEEI